MKVMISEKGFFPPRQFANPTICNYDWVDVAKHKGLQKIGFTLQP